jgi:hypothetical protein
MNLVGYSLRIFAVIFKLNYQHISFLTFLVVWIAAGCRKAEQKTDTTSSVTHAATSVSEAASIIEIDAERRIVFAGNVNLMRFQLQYQQQGIWSEQARYTIQRLPDHGESAETRTKDTFVDGRLISNVKLGAKNYRSVTFYHRQSGLLIHRMLCDHPGSLHVSATHESSQPNETSLLLIPFESTLETHGVQQLVRGEGECAVVISPGQDIDQSWQKTCEQYDPDGGKFPDVIRIIEQLDDESADAQSSNNHKKQ